MRDIFEVLKESKIKTTPGKTIKACRTNFNIELERLAQESGIAATEILEIEEGKVELTFDQAKRIGLVLGLGPEIILASGKEN
jgi:transcriptional regulator with XRE-family HTH domain